MFYLLLVLNIIVSCLMFVVRCWLFVGWLLFIVLIVVVDVAIAIVAVDLYFIATMYSFIFQSPLNRINVWGTPQINVHRRQSLLPATDRD